MAIDTATSGSYSMRFVIPSRHRVPFGGCISWHTPRDRGIFFQSYLPGSRYRSGIPGDPPVRRRDPPSIAELSLSMSCRTTNRVPGALPVWTPRISEQAKDAGETASSMPPHSPMAAAPLPRRHFRRHCSGGRAASCTGTPSSFELAAPESRPARTPARPTGWSRSAAVIDHGCRVGIIGLPGTGGSAW